MQTKLISKEAVSARFELTIPAADVDKTYATIFTTLARQIKVPGFRPGKAPKGVIMKRIGDEALAQEVKEELLDKGYAKAIKELELKPLHAQVLKDDAPVPGADYTVEIEVDLFPEFSLANIDDIVIDSTAEPLTDAKVQEAINRLRSEHATHVPVDRAIEEGDYIMVETLREGEEVGSSMPIDLERTNESLAAQLIGKAIDDIVDLDLSAEENDEEDEEDEEALEAAEKDDVSAESEAKAAFPKLKVRIKDVKAKEKPDLDDEFAKTLGFETWAEVEEAVRKNLLNELNNEAFNAQREEFIDKLVEETEVELPKYLLNRRKINMLENLAEDLKKQNQLSLDAYFKRLDEEGKREEFDKELQESAEKGVKRDLVLERLLEERETSLDDAEFENALRYIAYRQGTQIAKFKSQMGEAWLDNYRFLLTRDKAIREIVREKLGLENQDDAEEIAESIADEVPESNPEDAENNA